MRKWTENEMQYLKENYKNNSAKSIAIILDRSINAIHQMAHNLNLKKVLNI